MKYSRIDLNMEDENFNEMKQSLNNNESDIFSKRDEIYKDTEKVQIDLEEVFGTVDSENLNYFNEGNSSTVLSEDNENIEKGGVMQVDLDLKKIIKDDHSENLITLIFVLPNQEERIILVNEGESILDIAKTHKLPIEGACGGSLACSTCHVVIEDDFFKDELAIRSDLEEDMLDMVPNVKRTSRLGCQVIIKPWMNNMKIYLYNDGNFNSFSCSYCDCCCCSGDKK